jgi:Competence protein A.
MAKKVLSIVIGDAITKVCEVSYRKIYRNQGIRVYKSISFPTPENMIEDGYIRNKEAFCEKLHAQLQLANIRTKKAIFSIASSKIANREVIIPLVNEKRIADIIKTGAADYFPVDMKDYILSYIILEKKKSDRKENAQAQKQARLEQAIVKKQEKLDQKANRRNRIFAETSTTAPNRLMFQEDSPVQETRNAAQAGTPAGEQKEKDKKDKKHIRLSVYAVPSNLVKNYYNFAEMMGIHIVSLDYSGNSSYQMLKRQANEGSNVFIQLNEKDTVVSILSDNVLILQRTIGYGISTLVETVKEQSCLHIQDDKEAIDLLSSRNLLDLTASVSAPHGALPITSPEFEEAAVAGELITAAEMKITEEEQYRARRNIVESLQFLTNSISRMLDYYKNNHRNVEFKTIYLSGFGIRIEGIDQLFSEKIGIVNRKLEKLSSVSSKKNAQSFRLNPSEFMSCVGSVLKPVDFVPKELMERRERIHTIATAVTFLLLSLGATAALCFVSYNDYIEAKSEYEAADGQLKAMADISDIKNKYQKATEKLSDLQKMEETIQKDDRINEVLAGLEKNILSNAKIQSIQFSENGVVMNVMMADNHYGANTLVAKLLMQIKNIDLFAQVQDSNMTVSEDGEVSLTISCTYR